MRRQEFIKNCGFACLSSNVAILLLESCASSKTVSGKIVDTDILIPLASFFSDKKETTFIKYVVVEHPQLKYPICVFRFSEEDYSALLMQCTHQGAELQLFGDRLECPAHGSEFDNKGQVQNGPADRQLRSFPVIIVNNQIKISLKNV
ncbi:Rieske (2Fe-2S) protein [Sphingobacterium rhinopitheci]|uniref:Rieske (2Fe-2S) protein n=1 Tax=Sphingobacterium rhinopitheci TaxID=2781960 RepID=UPI001F518340|nr:Rieske (2Fe-2S) protein [Sphingobacterium rhinopitheci]MCI0922575.1 Rieske (2Fe-2S) protein [Sphingobacterium rhinopitheci]